MVAAIRITMSRLPPLPDTVSRESLIAALRQELSNRAGGRSICGAAAEQNIFCGGYHRFTDDELRERFAWLVRKRPLATRQEIEGLVDAWHLARQEVGGFATTCDMQQVERDFCNGWDDFWTDDLAKFYLDLTGASKRGPS
jgi:hypothetical protein